MFYGDLVSVLFNEPKLLKFVGWIIGRRSDGVSVLFNEPKLLKSALSVIRAGSRLGFSALQRAEIAEIQIIDYAHSIPHRFSALQRAEIAEILWSRSRSATQRGSVSVLFNEPKLLKSADCVWLKAGCTRFSALQRAEIAEIRRGLPVQQPGGRFQCSSTSRNC